MAPPIDETSADWVATVIPPRRSSSRKGENGVVIVVGGSRLYHGAPFLTAMAAMRSGVDLVYLFVPEKIAAPIRALSPSLIVNPLTDVKLTNRISEQIIKSSPQAHAAAIGPGLSVAKESALTKLLNGLLKKGIRLVLDASALQPYILDAVAGQDVVLTPHAGEFARLFGTPPGNSLEERCRAAKEMAKRHGIVILLKGMVDVITDGERLVVNRTGTCAMTVGGTGDVLTGIVAGLVAKGVPCFEAASASAYINGLCGEIAATELGLHILPTDLIEKIPQVMKKFDKIVS
ncbi:Bifunctional NAD(P)H-hydrate repair enzyme Nnr [Candidatus Calditenuaceae archaeon HR02]|nr:Bifunctional NAD(P)H-hydrate repair enzyme Nnr [Candidatus Calditenuaceae archaeon HR02]